MKTLISFLLIVLAFANLAHSQANFQYTVKVVNRSGNAAKDIKVWLYNKQNGEKLTERTNTSGEIRFQVPPGDWSVNLLGMPDYKEFDVRQGQSGHGSMLVSYDYQAIIQEQQFISKRKFTDLEEIDQSKLKPTYPQKGFCVVNVDISNAQRQPIPGLNVKLVSLIHKKAFLSQTDRKGRVAFLVPILGLYAADVENFKNYSFTKNILREGIVTLSLEYEPTSITETIKNDTITQQITPQTHATSSRSFVRLKITMHDGSDAEGENVYLSQVSSGKVYKSKTGQNGETSFLIPNGDRYLIHFEYEKDVDVINLTKIKHRNTINAKFSYSPDPRLQYPEKYIPTPDELFLQSFESFIETQLPEPEDKAVGLFLKWGNNIVNGKSTSAILQIGVSVSNKTVQTAAVPPLQLAFVVDKSGSMAGYDRIDALKTSLEDYIENMRSNDKLAIISFNGKPALDLPLQEKGSGIKAKQRVFEIEAGGGTVIYDALELGYKLLDEQDRENGSKHLVLLTDGYGSRPPAKVVNMSDTYTDKGIGLSAIGVGTYYNTALLTLLTAKTGRLLEHVGTAENLQAAFTKQLSNMLYPIGEDAELEITYNDKVLFKSIFGLNTASQSGNYTRFELGDLYKGFNKIALAKFELKKPNELIEKEPITIHLKYYDYESKKIISLAEKAYLKWSPEYNNAELILESEMKKLYAIAIMNQSMKVMAEAFVGKNYTKAKDAVESAYAQVKELFPEATDKDVDMLVSQLANYINGLTLCLQKERKK